ncbi:helix-turn-helix domain-containing protein [Agathobaculum sp.]|uniref:helix-turn-helix domain-containing protein n=1 Tax=Agathobaculum sp. TaxID=2048138 RepID=UPI003AF15C50
MMYCEVNVGERIRYFRNLRGWSQETLALQAEINPAFLGHLERGLKSPTIKTLEKIVQALDISLAELFADPQPVDNAKDAVIAQVCDQIRDLPLESIERINVIVRNVLAIEK